MDSTSIGSNGLAGDEPGKVPLTFARADQMYVSLKRLHETGVLTAEAFDEQLKQTMVKDSQGRWWSKSRDSGEWFYYDGTEWVRSIPPVESPVAPPVVPPIEETIVTSPVTTDTEGGSREPKPKFVEDLVGSDGLVDLGGMKVSDESVRLPDPVPDPTPDPISLTPPLAELGPRTLAFIIDQALLFVAGFIFGVVGVPGLAYVVGIGYFVYYWSTTGQTLGMKSQNIRVVRADGKPMTWETGVLRYVGYFIGALCILIGLLWVYWDPKRQGWHDKIAQTLVVRDNQ